MKFKFLSKFFYDTYDNDNYPELMLKEKRPYTQVITNINGLEFAVPLRSDIKHSHVLWTNKRNRCGLDFSKAIPIIDDRYIDNNSHPHIRNDEFKALHNKDFQVKKKMEKYINDYKQAKQTLKSKPNQHDLELVQYSALQYFEKYIPPLNNTSQNQDNNVNETVTVKEIHN